jgi:hypothetical protein
MCIVSEELTETLTKTTVYAVVILLTVKRATAQQFSLPVKQNLPTVNRERGMSS